MMTRTRPVLLAAALLASTALSAFAGEANDQIKAPVLRPTVNVTGDIVRVGDLIENAGVAANVAVYRAPDLGTTGVLPAAQVISTLRNHQVIGVDVRDVKEVSVTRLARAVDAKEISTAVAQALDHRNGLGDAASLAISFDQPVQDLKFDASSNGALAPTSIRFDPRSGRFDITFELGNASGASPTKLRYSGVAIETVEAAVLTRNIDRNEMIRSGDLQIERRPRAELGGAEPASRELAVGMQMRRPVRAGQALKTTDLAKPDLVQRDQTVTLIYQTAGIYLTTRGKALEAGTEGDIVSVLNLQSKRTITGRVTGRGQVTVDTISGKPAQTSEAEITAPVSVASRLPSSATPKAE
ncbi:flagellar basal body P-ring biosynthesis protein FlgA [Bradyrhizobium sp. SSBR45G]|uniref:flagellar basal body P-ring formation chaperone FlgA n=1 Tax=unclassified Bradyrhizobium TaxID=2631580 RepID=UPI002342AECE|nr:MULTISPECIES: flagellar basal body P-ring formation chaperone FlgA [unclassified Bradyrhizobium]GLH79653.1 flagellar basal body P-ring biosynthesis protein FlgA [Bradyrhizobium sp. SSBR45G]GLH86952.1 flagellar basal body P-ring biosynthesis protein FlgA [Bradyrhizobium sp. SSBR45R]